MDRLTDVPAAREASGRIDSPEVARVIDGLKAELAACRQDYDDLADAIAPTRHTVEDADMFDQRVLVAEARDNREVTNHECERLKEELASVRAERDRLAGKVATREQHIQQLIEERAALDQRRREVETANNAIAEDGQQLYEETVALKAELAAALARPNLEAERDALRIKLDLFRQQLTVQEARTAEWHRACDAAESALQTAVARPSQHLPTDAEITAWIEPTYTPHYEPLTPTHCGIAGCHAYVSDTRLGGYCTDCAVAIAALMLPDIFHGATPPGERNP